MSGLGLRLKIDLKALAERHGTLPPRPRAESLLPDCDGEHTLSGICSDYEVDLQRMRFRKYALGWLPWQLPTLEYAHEGTAIGIVKSLAYTDSGLRATVVTDDPRGKVVPAFSITGTVKRYTIENADDPANYHALVTDAWLDSISLTAIPANPRACVLQRAPVDPQLRFLDLMKRRVGLMIDYVRILESRA